MSWRTDAVLNPASREHSRVTEIYLLKTRFVTYVLGQPKDGSISEQKSDAKLPEV